MDNIRPPDEVPFHTVEHQELTMIVADNRTCECDLPDCGPGRYVVNGAAVCERCFNHITLRCPKCGWREFGRYVDGDEHIQCSRCEHSWAIPDDEVASELPTR